MAHDSNARSQTSGRKWLVFIACCVTCAFGFGGGMTCFSLFVRPLVAALDVPVASVSLFFTIMTVVSLPAVIIAPKLLEKSSRAFVGICGVACGVGLLLLANMPSLPMLFFVAVIYGLALSPSTVLAAPIVISNWLPEKKGTFVGVALACTGIGGAALSPVFTALIAGSGWQFAMRVLGIMLIVAVGVVGFAFMSFAPSKASEEAARTAGGQAAETVKPGLTAKEFFHHGAAFVLCLSLLFAGVTASINQQANVIAQLSGFSATTAGIVVSCMALGSVFGKLLLGAMRDKRGSTAAGTLGSLLMVLGFVIMSAGVANVSDAVMFAGSFVTGLGACMGTMGAPLFTMDAAGPRDYGQIYGILSACVSVGVAVGNPLVSGLYDATGSYLTSLVVLAVLAAAIALLSVPSIHKMKSLWKGTKAPKSAERTSGSAA